MTDSSGSWRRLGTLVASIFPSANADDVRERAADVDGEHVAAHATDSPSGTSGPRRFHFTRSTEHRHFWHFVAISQPFSLRTG